MLGEIIKLIILTIIIIVIVRIINKIKSEINEIKEVLIFNNHLIFNYKNQIIIILNYREKN